jgi:hypothetical protein
VDAAREKWERAYRILDGLAHPDAAGVRERLAALRLAARSSR